MKRNLTLHECLEGQNYRNSDKEKVGKTENQLLPQTVNSQAIQEAAY